VISSLQPCNANRAMGVFPQARTRCARMSEARFFLIRTTCSTIGASRKRAPQWRSAPPARVEAALEAIQITAQLERLLRLSHLVY
jgi:hypothetical protein